MATEEGLEGAVKIPIGMLSLIAAIIVQTGAAVWWASGQSSDMATVKATVVQMHSDSFSRAEAISTQLRTDQMNTMLSTRIIDLQSRVEQIASQQQRTEAIVMQADHPRTK